jgi:zinc/manganese transport system substrate-binding protein
MLSTGWRKTPSRRFGMAVAAVTALVLLAGCGSGSTNSGSTKSEPTAQKVSVVTSTTVYGDIARQIGGESVRVTSLISDPAQDPHSYEATATAALAVSKADVIIENGGGYDDFVDTMRSSASRPAVTVLNVVQLSGRNAPANGGLNEHFWYDLPTVVKLAQTLAQNLGRARPTNAAQYQANAEAFVGKVTGLQRQAAAINQAHAGTGVMVTEPVPLYLLTAAGLRDLTPPAFSQAIEEGTDVPPTVLREVFTTLGGGKVRVLAYNEQTADPQTEQIKAQAKADGVAVVSVTETLPAGKDYISWMSANLTALSGALGS